MLNLSVAASGVVEAPPPAPCTPHWMASWVLRFLSLQAAKAGPLAKTRSEAAPANAIRNVLSLFIYPLLYKLLNDKGH